MKILIDEELDVDQVVESQTLFIFDQQVDDGEDDLRDEESIPKEVLKE